MGAKLSKKPSEKQIGRKLSEKDVDSGQSSELPTKTSLSENNDNNVKLPHNYEEIIQEADSPIDRSSIKRLYDQLCAGVLLNQKRQRYWIESDSGGNSFMMFARDMSIIWMGDRRYWKWTQIPVDETSNEMVDAAELLAVCWLEVEAKFDTKKLSPGITYEVGFVIMLRGTSYGWEVPVCLEMQLENGIKQERKENFLTKPRNRWIEIAVGEFSTAPENEGEMKISLTEHKSGKWKGGLVIKGILIQPKI